jgi:hypothetical protein
MSSQGFKIKIKTDASLRALRATAASLRNFQER